MTREQKLGQQVKFGLRNRDMKVTLTFDAGICQPRGGLSARCLVRLADGRELHVGCIDGTTPLTGILAAVREQHSDHEELRWLKRFSRI